MTVNSERHPGDYLRSVWPEVAVGASPPLSGGFWATMFRVEVSGQPAGVPSEVVVRFAPNPAMGAKEAAVQQAVADLGFPTPAVHVSQPDGRGGWWSVMDYAPGSHLLAGLDGIEALRHGISLAQSVPTQLATAMARLHRLDPGPVTQAVRAAAPDVAWTVIDVLDRLNNGAVADGRTDVAAALDRLSATMPPPDHHSVLCHGDLHPFNLLDTGGKPLGGAPIGVPTREQSALSPTQEANPEQRARAYPRRPLVVLDWTAAVEADPCYDVTYTELLLSNPPLQLPGALAPTTRAVGRLLARRFIRAYARAYLGPGEPVSPESRAS